MKTIYLYREGDTVFADTQMPGEADLIREYRLYSKRDAERLISNPGTLLPQRIIALAERLATDLPKSGMSRPIGQSISGR